MSELHRLAVRQQLYVDLAGSRESIGTANEGQRPSGEIAGEVAETVK
jgi:hypothetical protein